ncbi:MAG: glycosyl hydrolase 53 family protein [Bacteroidales bacterium]|nr:glycosyl hydrolase 53 family protein [Bacteroidales bacterium]
MKRFLIGFQLAIMCFCAVSQSVTMSFTGYDDSGNYIQLNRVLVVNHTQGWNKTVFWPDTAFTVQYTAGADDMMSAASVQLLQNTPNPFNTVTDVCLTVAYAGEAVLSVSDMSGRVVASAKCRLQSGTHRFSVSVANAGTYLMTARQNGKVSSVKMVCDEGGRVSEIRYQDMVSVPEGAFLSSPSAPQGITVRMGDKMEFVGYADIDGAEKNTRCEVLSQGVSRLYGLQFVLSGNRVAGPAAVSGKTEKANGTEKANEEENNKAFRVALSLSPFSLNQFANGYTFAVGDRTAATPEELQQIYRDLGSTEMYVRIATKRHVTEKDVTDGKPDENANVHTFDQGIRLCRIAADLDIPINPEIMCAYTYMDMDKQQAPRFEEYPEIYALQNGKEWSELTLDEICTVLEAYGAFIGEAVLNTGCTVNNWNLGNEANFGFAGISMGLETAVNPKLKKAGNLKKYTAPVFARGWLKRNVWQYDAKAYAAVKRGILSAYEKLGMDASGVKFSTHIATVVFPPKCSVDFFNYMKQNGYVMETAGISYYPSAPSMSVNKKKLLKKTISKINEKCGLPVFVGEFSYPSGKMDGPFAGWNKKVRGYQHSQQGQADIYADVISWGKTHGMAGIRYWAPDYKGWYAMSMFEFSGKKGTAKIILKNHREIIEK